MPTDSVKYNTKSPVLQSNADSTWAHKAERNFVAAKSERCFVGRVDHGDKFTRIALSPKTKITLQTHPPNTPATWASFVHNVSMLAMPSLCLFAVAQLSTKVFCTMCGIYRYSCNI